MSLYKQWTDLIQGQTDSTIDAFWDEYSGAETRIYTDILANYPAHLTGKVGELADKYECSQVIFTGFLDGINSSLKEENDLKGITADSEIDLDIDFEKLYFNMHKADADYLWSIEEWNHVLSDERREEIYTDFRRSRTVHVEKKPGRNDPCPCGSGKKYKNCCGKRA